MKDGMGVAGSGGLDAYYFGAHLMAHILPENSRQPLVQVDVLPPDGREKAVTDGIYGKEEVLDGIRDAMKKIEEENPDRIITIGGNCMVSLAPFDYLHGRYENLGIIWIDAHPDVSTVRDGYPNAHAMVLGSLMGYGGGTRCPYDEKQALSAGGNPVCGASGPARLSGKFPERKGR